MYENNYSKEIANLIKKSLDGDDWYYTFDEKKGEFDFSMSLNSGYIKKVLFEIKVKEDYYIVYIYPPFGADIENKNMMSQMAEFICRANRCIRTGVFEFDFEDGEIRLKNLVECCNLELSEEIILDSIYTIITTFKFNSLGLFNILTEKTTAKEACKLCIEAIFKKAMEYKNKELSEDDEGE